MTKAEAEKIYGKPLTDEQFARLAASRGERAEFPAYDQSAKPQVAHEVMPQAYVPPKKTPDEAPPGYFVMENPDAATFDPKTGTWMQPAKPPADKPLPMLYGGKSPQSLTADGMRFGVPDTSPRAIATDKQVNTQFAPYTEPSWQMEAELADAEQEFTASAQPPKQTTTYAADGSAKDTIGQAIVSKPRKKKNPYEDI